MVAAICALHEAWDPDRYGMLPDVVSRYARWLPERAADPRSVFLVADDHAAAPRVPHRHESGLAGFLIGTVEENIPIYRVHEFGFIHDLWVEPDFRGKGVGAALARAAIDRFRAIGVTQLRLETALPNSDARSLFERCGFRSSSVEMLRNVDANAGETRASDPAPPG